MDANYDVVADGYYAYFNGYDSKVYVIGKGPSETSMNIQNNVLTLGSSVLIEGTVTDIAAGTKQDEQAARFPQGVPAVSDASQKAWMEYVYFQKHGQPTLQARCYLRVLTPTVTPTRSEQQQATHMDTTT
jgi:hypothetical protein